MSQGTTNKVLAQQLNALIQNHIYEKLGKGVDFSIQYNEEYAHIYVKLKKEEVVIEDKQIKMQLRISHEGVPWIWVDKGFGWEPYQIYNDEGGNDDKRSESN